MTKKFFNDWSNKRSLTKRIELNSLSFEEKGKKYYVYDHQLVLNTLDFEGDYILISANISRNKRKKKVDGVAAEIILQSYLDRVRKGN